MPKLIKSEDYFDSLYEMRLLMFLECDDEECGDKQYTHFHQVILDKTQFKKVSDDVILEEKEDSSLKKGYNLASIRLGNIFPAIPFDGLSSTI